MTPSDSSPTLPRVGSHLPGPGEIWISRHSETRVKIISRDEHGVRYAVPSGSGTMPWITPLDLFMDGYQREVSAEALTDEQIRWTFVHCSDTEIANACRIALGLWRRDADDVARARVKVAAAFNVRRAELGGAP